MEEKKINMRIVFSVVAVLLLIAVVAGATYAYFSATGSSAAQTVTTASLDLAFDDSTAIINATNITPMYQSEIETKSAKKSFTVTNNGTQSMYLQMNLTEVTIDDELKDVWFRWALYEDGTRIGMGTFYKAGTEVFMQQNMVIEPGTANAKNYDLYIWIEESDEDQNIMQGKTFSGKITVNGSMTEYEGIPVYSTWVNENWEEQSGVNYAKSDLTTYVLSAYDWGLSGFTATTDFSKFTKLEDLTLGNSSGYAGWYYNYFPVSLIKLDLGYNCSDNIDLEYLTNLKELVSTYEYYDYGNISIKLPRSLEILSGFDCSDVGNSYTETHDFSNLVNLKTVSANSFGHLTSEDTIILPKSIQGTVSIGTGAFGSATIVYQ